MSFRYPGAWIEDGAFNPLTAPTPIYDYTYYLNSWGNNGYGTLALNNVSYYSSPKQVGALTNWSVVAAGNLYALAVKTDGTAWAWGQNNSGKTGLGTSSSYAISPVQIGSLTNWSTISAGHNHSLAVKTDGTLWSWGGNAYGALGLGNTTYYSSPKQIGALTNWRSVSAGFYYSMAIKTDGTLWGWGTNSTGNIGNGNTTSYSSPKQVGALTTWLQVAAGYYQTAAIKTDGALWCWGYNAAGQLGLGNTTIYSSPKQVGSLTNWASTQVGAYFTCAVKTDGTLWTWGRNAQGQLGTSNTTYYSSPKQVGTLTNWSKTSAQGTTGRFMLALKTDKTLWSWGQNNSGQLGISNTTNYSSPKQIGALTTWGTPTAGSIFSLALIY